MFRRFRTCLAALALASAVFSAHAQDGPLDPRFGDGGMRNYGFPSYNGSGRSDRAAAACPGPNGTLLVVGEASDASRIVTVRLLPNGDYDSSFGAGGRATLELPMTQEPNMAGLCQPDGKIVLARRIRVDADDVNSETNIQLLRIHAHDGQLDTTFGQNGLSLLDLDAWQSGLSRREDPYALMPLDRGEVLLLGQVGVADDMRGFAALISADGSVPRARVYGDVVGWPAIETLMTAAPASDGTIWAIAEGNYPRIGRISPFRMRLQRETLDRIDMPDPVQNENYEIYAGVGMRVRDDVLAVPMLVKNASSRPTSYSPALGIYRAGGKVILWLPRPQYYGERLSLARALAQQHVTLLPGNRVFYAATLARAGSGSYGVHTGLVEIGAAIGQDRIDNSLGQGGEQSVSFLPVGGSCTRTLVPQWLAGVTTWAGLPVFVGAVDMSCTDPAVRNDYLVGRVLVDRIFVDGFR